MLQIIGLFLLGLAVPVAIAYLFTQKALGPQAARQNTAYALPWLLLGGLLSLLLFFAGQSALSALYLLYAVCVWVWLASWPIRKKRAGDLLLRVDSTLQTKVLFWLGLLLVGVAITMTLPLIQQITDGLVPPVVLFSGIAKLACWWTIALLFIAFGQSNLELHEQGFTYSFAWQPWERITAFGWDDDRPNTLILKAKPRTAISRRYITMSIPAAQVDEVDRLLEMYLLESDLAAEMDGESLASS